MIDCVEPMIIDDDIRCANAVALQRVLEEQQTFAATLPSQDTIVRYVFCFADGAKAGQRITESGFKRHGARRA